MNPYAPFPGELTLSPPGKFNDTRFFYFLLAADKPTLQACCDRYLNVWLPAGGLRYRAHGAVFLAFSHVEELVSGDPKSGRIRYKDIAFWIPVSAEEGGGASRLCLFPPSIFVDDAATLATGREVFGLPKQLGRFQMPLAPEEIPSLGRPQFRLEVRGTLQDGGPSDWRTLLTIQARRGVGEPSVLRDAASFAAAVTSLLDLPTLFDVERLPETLSTRNSVGLRQFRDPTDPARSTYSAIVEAPLRMTSLREGPRFFVGDFDVDLEAEPVPSHPVCGALGLRRGRQEVKAAVYFRADMAMLPGRVIWSSR